MCRAMSPCCMGPVTIFSPPSHLQQVHRMQVRPPTAHPTHTQQYPYTPFPFPSSKPRQHRLFTQQPLPPAPLVLQDLLEDSHAHGTDASGNPILKDIGMFMRSELKSYFKDGDIKYIDPSYIIRWVRGVWGGIQHAGLTEPSWARLLVGSEGLRRGEMIMPALSMLACQTASDDCAILS